MPIPLPRVRFLQQAATQFGDQLRGVVSDNSRLATSTELILWHGSLVHGRGGAKYDIDYAVFANVQTPDQLLEFTDYLSSTVEHNTNEIRWRRDTHYDGISMFEAHTHWDPVDKLLPHIGVHLYRHIALDELFGEQTWRIDTRHTASFYRVLEAWRRFVFFFRNWIYEGRPIYDPKSVFVRAQNLDWKPPAWLREELMLAAKCALRGYANNSADPCTDPDGRATALSMVATLAYLTEGIPEGRSTRFTDDAAAFRDSRAAAMLNAAVAGDLNAAAELLIIP